MPFTTDLVVRELGVNRWKVVVCGAVVVVVVGA